AFVILYAFLGIVRLLLHLFRFFRLFLRFFFRLLPVIISFVSFAYHFEINLEILVFISGTSIYVPLPRSFDFIFYFLRTILHFHSSSISLTLFSISIFVCSCPFFLFCFSHDIIKVVIKLFALFGFILLFPF